MPPAPAASIGGSARRHSSVRARTLRSIISIWRPASSSANRPPSPKPALLIKVPTSSPSAATASNNPAAAPGAARSAAIACAPPNSAASASSRSLRRATSTSSSPRAGHGGATSPPSPAEAPVTSVTGRAGTASGPQAGFDDPAGLARRLALGQGVDMLHAFGHLAPHRILAVEEAGVVEADEELAVGAVGVLRARHRRDSAHVRLAREFGREVGLVRSAHAAAGRVAALGHEAEDDAVEDHAVVKAFLGELADARDMARREV